MDVLVAREELLDLSKKIFMSKGVPEKDAMVVSDALVEANLRGHDSHGVIRIPKWVAGLETGAINPLCRVKTIKQMAAGAVLDGDRGLGPVVGVTASNIAIFKAKDTGICAVSVRRASHIGMLGYYSEMMAMKGMIGICMTNTEPGMAPFGGAEKVLGTNPIAIGIPNRNKPLILDMSTSVVARGKIVLAKEKGEEIPEGWAINKDGEITKDPREALEGALLPLGGPKGSGLAIMVDLLTGALAGAAVGKNVKGTFDMKHEGTKGDLFMAIDPKSFTDFENFLDKVEELKDQIKHSKKAKGVKEILLPGEIEYMTKERREKEGILLTEESYKELIRLAERQSV
ncbi:MAG: Ldh family oxidoreductase [Thermodesulfobacteriota bacterium]|nr:Ldh family oxidoreductase [Thermodesulfobacteriota bacterium]